MTKTPAAQWGVRASSALFGFSLAIGFAPRLQMRANAEDLLSALKVAGYSPRGLLLQFALALLLTAVFALAGERAARLLDGRRWAQAAYCAVMLLAPISLIAFGNVRHVIFCGIAAAAIVGLREREPRFERGDVILFAVLISCYLAFLDLAFGGTPIATFLRAAAVVIALRIFIASSDAFVIAPAALALQSGWLPATAAAVVALAIIVFSPLAARRIVNPSRWRRVVYPIIAILYPLALLRVPPPVVRANFFEDSHHTPVAYEMARGERPYRDIVPTHGLIADGGIELVAMKIGVTSMRGQLTAQYLSGVLTALAIYLLAVAATGIPELGLLGVFFGFMLDPGATMWVRPAGSLLALAAVVAATRFRMRRWFVAAGALVVLAYLISVDFGVYAAIVALFAAIRSRATRQFLTGFAAAFIACLAIFAAFGFATDFIRVNVTEVFGGHAAGYLRPIEIPDCLRSAAIIHQLPVCFDSYMWVIALIGGAVALARSPFRARPTDGVWLIGLWMVVGAAAFVRRGNFQFTSAMPAFVIAALWLVCRSARTTAIALAIFAAVFADPVHHIIAVIPELRRSAPPPLFDSDTEASIEAARTFTSTLRRNETFADFSNAALLYPLLGRDCPLRLLEVASYQNEREQQEVIHTIETNPRIRAVLVRFRASNQNVDGIPNSVRAPLVWAYLQRAFTPAFDEAGVVFWKRR